MNLSTAPRKAMTLGAMFASTVLLFSSAFGQSSSLGNGNSGGPNITAPAAVKFAQSEADDYAKFFDILVKVEPGMKDDQVRKLLIDNNYSDGVIMLEVLRDLTNPWIKNPGRGDRDTRYRFIESDKGVQAYFHEVRKDPNRFSFALAMVFYWGSEINQVADTQSVSGFNGGDLATAARTMLGLNINLNTDVKLDGVIKLTNGYAKNRFANGATDEALKKFLAIPDLTPRASYLVKTLFPELGSTQVKATSNPPPRQPGG